MKNYSFLSLVLGALLCVPLAGAAQNQMRIEAGTSMNLGNAHLVSTSTSIECFGPVAAENATITFTGDESVVFRPATTPVGRINLNQSNGKFLTLLSDLAIIDLLDFQQPVNNYLRIGDHSLYLGAVAQVQGAKQNSHVVTDGNGFVFKDEVGNVPFQFPVGYLASAYLPVELAEQQAPTQYGVRSLPDVYQDGATGPAISSQVVDGSWEVVGGTPGEMDLFMNVQWTLFDELSGFNRARCGVAQYDPSILSWDLTVNDLGPATGTDPYQRERIGITEPGFFAVGGAQLAPEGQAEVDVLLGGGYLSAGMMGDVLRENNLLPLVEPYSGLGFQQKGFGGGETVEPEVFQVAGPDAIVDWVLVEVRDGEAPDQIIATRSGLLQRDGDIVDTDGVSPLQLAGLAPASYYLAIQHRNHIGIMTAAPLDFSTGNVEFSFLVDPEQAFGGTNGVADLGDGFYGLISGDFDRNGQVQNTDGTGLTQTLGASGYQQGDLDLNGQVQNIDLQLKLSPNLGRGRQF